MHTFSAYMEHAFKTISSFVLATVRPLYLEKIRQTALSCNEELTGVRTDTSG